MRLLIQRVSQASVKVEGETVGVIDQGLLCFFGAHKEDKPEETKWLVEKLLNLRIFTDERGLMNLSVQDIGGNVLIVSQFTLYGDCCSGRRPGFDQAAPPDLARPLYEKFVKEVREQLPEAQTGRFAAKMEVGLINDGPVTFIVERGYNRGRRVS